MLTTSPAASAPGGLRAWASRGLCVGARAENPSFERASAHCDYDTRPSRWRTGRESIGMGPAGVRRKGEPFSSALGKLFDALRPGPKETSSFRGARRPQHHLGILRIRIASRERIRRACTSPPSFDTEPRHPCARTWKQRPSLPDAEAKRRTRIAPSVASFERPTAPHIW